MSVAHQLSSPRRFWVGTAHCLQGTPYRTCLFGDALTQSSCRYIFCSCQSRSDPYACPFLLFTMHQLQEATVHLIYPTSWQVPLKLDNQCNSLHLSAVSVFSVAACAAVDGSWNWHLVLCILFLTVFKYIVHTVAKSYALSSFQSTDKFWQHSAEQSHVTPWRMMLSLNSFPLLTSPSALTSISALLHPSVADISLFSSL